MHTVEEISAENKADIENRLRLLHKIVSQKSPSLEDHLRQALKLTTKLLGMEVGIISSINGDTYTVMTNYSAGGHEIKDGQVCDLQKTFCKTVANRGKIVTISDTGKASVSKHPCFDPYQMKSYIGSPIHLDNELYGTLNFSSSKPKKSPFLEADKTLIKLLAEWVSSVIRRKRIEQSYQESERLYKLISTNSYDLICLHNPDGTYRFVSPSAEKITGYHPTELLGKSPYDFFHKEDLKRIQESHKVALENSPYQSMQYRFKKKSGEYIWLDTATQPITKDNGEVVNLQTTSRDITKRKRLEILFSQAQQMAHVGGWELELKSGKIIWTDEVYKIHEKPIGEQVYLEDALEFFPGDAKQKIQEAIEYALETGKKYDVAVPFVTARGNHRWVRAIGQAIFADEKPYKLRGTFQDITQYKEYELKIKDQNQQLKEVTATRDKLYSIIGHDLKNTFFGLFGLISMMKENTEAKEQTVDELMEHFDLLQTSTKQAYQLLENLLEWIKMQRHGISFLPKEVKISELIRECIEVHEVVAKNKNITIETDLHECPLILCDPEMIKTCLRNLVSNAIKFSSSGSTVNVSVIPNQEDVIINVKDSGIGMPEHVRESLFDPANRPKRHGTNSERGTGLGLLLCKEFVDLHGGKIDVSSIEGEGSEFKVGLPIHAA